MQHAKNTILQVQGYVMPQVRLACQKMSTTLFIYKCEFLYF